MSGFDHFSHLAPFYDRAIPFKSLEGLLMYGHFMGDEIVLDAGGGTGRVAEALMPHVRNVVVADLSKGMLGQAAQKGFDALLTQVELLPFQNETFNRVVMFDALHHVINQTNAANEMWRILTPGGMVIIQEPNIHKFPVKLIALAEKIALMRSHFLSPKEIIQLFDRFPGETTEVDDEMSTWIIVRKPNRF